MNLVQSLEQGRRLIQKGKAWGKNTTPIEETVKALEERLAGDIQTLRLSELAKRSMAIEVYSEILGCGLWLCSNEEMASQVKEDDPEAVCYTVDEIRHLYKLQPSPDDLRAMHNVKNVFDVSRVIDSSLKESKNDSDG